MSNLQILIYLLQNHIVLPQQFVVNSCPRRVIGLSFGAKRQKQTENYFRKNEIKRNHKIFGTLLQKLKLSISSKVKYYEQNSDLLSLHEN